MKPLILFGFLLTGFAPSVQAGPPSSLVVGPLAEDIPRSFRTFFSQEVEVFGVKVLASKDTPERKVRHAAAVLQQYLDNDADGAADNPKVLAALTNRPAAIVMWPNERAAERSRFFDRVPDKVLDRWALVGLWGEETIPDGAAKKRFDATLEEVLHLITSAGYAEAYPDVFGERPGSQLALAMDKARGGHFKRVPRDYPKDAWYSYDDRSCDYACQVTEYIYWGLTSLLGAQDFPGRGREIQHEWRLNTPASFAKGDPNLHALLTDPRYRFPTKQPHGIGAPPAKNE